MTVFSSFRKGRQAAKEHKAKQAEQERKDEIKPAYRHIPSHAAIDALNSTPQAWRHEDAPRIAEANRRHSERAASGYGRVSSFMSLNTAQLQPGHSTGTMPRVSSSLSHVTFPNGYHNPVVQIPRSCSAQSLQPPVQDWNRGGAGPSPCLRRGDNDGPPFPSPRGKGGAADTSSAMPEQGRAGANPYSSSDSTSSQDDLDMTSGPSKRARAGSNASQGPSATKPSTSSQPHRLHPARRLSDPSAFSPTRSAHHLPARGDSYYPPSASACRAGPRRPNSGHSPTSASAPTSNNIPPVPILPRGLVTSSSHSLSSSSSGGTDRSKDPADTPTTALSPDMSPTQQEMPGTFRLDAGERSAAETYADIIPDFAPLGHGFAEPAPKTGTSEIPAIAQQRHRRPATQHSEENRVTNFSRLSIRSNSSLVREAPNSTFPAQSNPSPATAALPHVQAPAPARPAPQHAFVSFERSPVKPGTLPTRFIESGFDDPTPAHRPAPKPPTSAPEPAPAAKRGRLTKRSSAAPAPKEKEVEETAKKSRWGRK